MKSPITTHVLDTATGSPAKGVPVILSFFQGSHWEELAKGVTNDDGRVADLLSPDTQLSQGVYKMLFDTSTYFKNNDTRGFYPYVEVVFDLRELDSHYHIPLLLSPFGYSTYRGS